MPAAGYAYAKFSRLAWIWTKNPKHEKKGVKSIIEKQEKWFQFLGARQQLVYTLRSLMPSDYQKENFEAMPLIIFVGTRLSWSGSTRK